MLDCVPVIWVLVRADKLEGKQESITMQFLGPMKKGWNAARSSLAYGADESTDIHLSGIKLYGL